MTSGRLAIAVIVVALSLLERASVQAEPSRVALVGAPANLERATATALESWEVEVVSVPDDARLHDAGSEAHARAVAEAHGAAAVVWLSQSPAGHTLWVYDVAQDRVLSRPLSAGPPISDPTAASLALSIKTMLRNSMDPAVRPSPPKPRPAPPPAVEPQSSTPRPEPPPRLRLEALAAVRPGLGQNPATEPRLAVGTEWSPAMLPSSLALALALTAGPGAAVERGGFDGALTDIALGVELRRYLAIRPFLRMAGALGSSMHLTHLDGRLTSTDEAASVWRFLVAVDAAVTMRVQITPALHGDLRLAGAYLPYRQRYQAYGRPVVDLPRFTAVLGAGLSMALPW